MDDAIKKKSINIPDEIAENVLIDKIKRFRIRHDQFKNCWDSIDNSIYDILEQYGICTNEIFNRRVKTPQDLTPMLGKTIDECVKLFWQFKKKINM